MNRRSTPTENDPGAGPVRRPTTRAGEPADERRALGRRGEDLAVEVLRAAGIATLQRNWRCREGEVDIVGRDTGTGEVVLCEVKCRRGLGYGDPLEAITHAKLGRLRRLAGAWRAAHPEERSRVRLDAVGVLWPRGAAPSVRHLRGVGG